VKEELERKKIIPAGYDSLQDLERELDRTYYRDLIALAEDADEELLVSFLRREVDMRNIKILLRLVHEDADFELIRNEMLPSGRKVTPATLEKFKGLSFEEVVRKINGLYTDFELRPDESLTIMEQDVDKQHILYGEKISHLHMFTPLMVLGFILRKYQEIINLRLITRGKQLDIPKETIERMLVI
jgi:V/A-type H+-transporting ATPase subunit C